SVVRRSLGPWGAAAGHREAEQLLERLEAGEALRHREERAQEREGIEPLDARDHALADRIDHLLLELLDVGKAEHPPNLAGRDVELQADLHAKPLPSLTVPDVADPCHRRSREGCGDAIRRWRAGRPDAPRTGRDRRSRSETARPSCPSSDTTPGSI